MKKFTFLFFAMLMSVLSWQGIAQVFIDENFSGGVLPTGWTNNDLNGSGQVWEFDNPGGVSANLPISAPFAILDSDNYGSGGIQNAALETPAFDASSATSVFLDFDYYHRQCCGATIYVEVFNGDSWVEVHSESSESANPAHLTLDITTALAGATNAQVRFRYTGSWDWYWIIDNVRIAPPPTCLSPSDLVVASVASNTADISWTAGDTETSWNVSWGAPGYTPGDTDEISTAVASTNSYQIGGLSAGSHYDVYVQANCGAIDGESTWAGPVSFSTTQIPATLPYADDFSTNQFTFVNGGQTNKWAYGTAVGNPGSFIYISNDNGTTNAYTTNASSVTQAYRDISIPSDATSAEFSFDWRATGEGETYKYDYLRVWMVPTSFSLTAGSQITAAADRIKVGSDLNLGSGWTTYQNTTLDLSTFAGQTMRLVFEWRNDFSSGAQPPAAIDNISLEIPTCPAPLDLMADAIAATTADVSWTAGDAETAWNISWGASGYTPGVDDLGTDTASTTSYQLAGLTPQTSYDVYVQADCGSSDLSNWAGPLSFTTACGTITEMFEDFDSYATGSIVPDCWERIVPATSAGSQSISSTSPASGNRNIYQYTSSTSNSVIVALPEFSNVNAGTHWLKLKARVTSGSGALSVGYVTDVTDYDSFTLIEDVAITNTSYASNSEYTVVIPNTVPAGARLGIKSAANGTSHYWDDVSWEQVPSCFEPSSLEVTGLTSTTVDVAWMANNSETSWNVSWGAPGYTPGDTDEISTAVASTNSYQIGGLSADSHYDVYVQANCGAVDGESTWAGPLSVYTGYCIPSGSSNNTDEIRNFTLNNLNNDSAASEGTNGYSDYTTSVAPAELQAGVSYTASLTSGTGSGNHGAAIWIDLDQNLVFDSSEMVAFLPSTIGANATVDFPAFTLPPNLPLGTYRLRVQYHYSKSGDLLDPCVTTTSYSETEDYAVTVLAPPACLPPVDILADSITSSSADINWTESGTANTWHIEYGITGFTQGDGTTVPNITSRPYNLTGLSANTQYDVYVRSVCGAGTLNPTISDWTGPYTFRTDCGVISVLPYNEDFDTYGTGSAAFPACWTRPVTYTSGSTWPSIVSLTGAPSSPNALKFQSLTTEATYAVSPSYAEDINNLRVTFMLRREGPNSGTIDVGVMSDANDINTFELVQTIDPATGWIEYTINLNQVNLSGSGNFIAFRHNSETSNWFYWMDDFKVELLPSCLEPTALTTTSIGSNTADIEWIAGGSETAWNISWGAPGYTPGDGDLGTDTASTASYQLAGLTPQTSYDVYVQADCGGDLSSWTGPLSFTTNCVVVSDFYEDFEATTGTNLPNCWSKVGTTGTVDTRASAKLSGARVLYVYNNVTVALPVVDNAAAGTHQIAMDVVGNISSGGTIELGYLTDATDATSFVSISSITTNSTTVSQEFTTIPTGMPAGDVVFAIYSPGTTSSYIDNVRWEPIPTCPTPTDLTVAAIEANTADIEWEVGNVETAWNVSWGALGYTPGLDDLGMDNVSTTPAHQITGLDANTAYEVYVQAYCGGSDFSIWVGPVIFTTLCSFTSVPYVMDFETATVPNLPACTSRENNGIGNDWKTSTSASGFTGKVLNYSWHSTSGTANSWFFTQGIQLYANTTYDLSFLVGNNTNYYTESMKVSYGTSPTESAMVKEITDLPEINTSTPLDRLHSFNPPSDGVYYFGFNVYSIDDQNQLYLDDISIVETPACPTPTDLTVAAIEANTADIEWEVGNVETAWNISWGTPGYTPGLDALGMDNVSTTPAHQITGLDANTAYEVYVQADCGGSDLSNWVGPVSFTTSCETGTVPFAEGFENSYSNDVPLSGCWSQENGNWRTHNVSSTYGRAARTGDSYVSLRYGNDDWIYYPLNLTGGTTYTLSFYARQDATSGASVKASFGTSPSVSAMTNEILPQTDVTSDTYMEFSENFTPNDNGVYYIGINGTLNYTPWYLTIDDISVTEATTSGYVYENGAWSPSDPSGVATSDDDITVIDNTASLTADTQVRNLTVMAGATLEVNNVLTLGGDIINDGNLVFVSSATGNGELAAVPGTSTITGDVTVQRYMQNKRSYRMVSSPVTTTTSIHDNWQEGASSNADNPNPGFGTHITGSTTDQMNGFDGTITGNPSMFTVNVNAQEFEAIDNTNTNTLTAGDPYLLFVRGDRSIDLTNDLAAGETALRATGSLVTGPHSQSFPTATNGNFVMFGNPYQSAVNVNDVFAGSTNVNSDFLYVYDPSAGTHGAYVTVSLPGGTNAMSSTANQYLQPGQGAQVAVTGAATVNFTEATKAPGQHNTTNATGNGLMSDNMLTVQLFTTENFNNGGSVHDGLAIIFGDGLNNAVTNADAIKPMNFYENLGRDHNGTYLSIEKREMPQSAEVFPLYSAGYSQSEYTLKMNIDGLEDTFLYLDDHFTGTSTLIEGETIYTFGVDRSNDMSVATDRFSVRVEQRLGVDDNGLLSGVRLFPNPLSDNTFYVNAPKLTGETVNVTVNDMLGREVYNAEHTFSDSTVHINLANDITSGVYMVTLSSNGEVKTLRIIKD